MIANLFIVGPVQNIGEEISRVHTWIDKRFHQEWYDENDKSITKL